MSADAARVDDTNSIVSDTLSIHSESNLPSADEEDDISYDEVSLRMDNWGEAEVDLFFFVKKWVEADEDRKQHINNLLERIRFYMMTLAELTQIQSSKLYSENSGAWRALLDKTVGTILSADAARVCDIESSKVSDTDSVYSETNLPSADEDDDPAHISYHELCLLIDSWREAEVDLLFFVKKWVEADEDNRRQHLDDLMEHIRFCLMTPAELTQIQSTKMYTEASGACRVLVDKAIAYHKLPINIKILQDSQQSTVRGKPAVTCLMDIMEFDCNGFPRSLCKHLYTLDNDMDWNKAIIPPHFPFGHRVDCVVFNNFLFTTSADNRKQEFYVFDPRTLKYSQMASLGKSNEKCSLVHHQGCLYHIGGSATSHKGSVHGTIQKYEFQTNKWSDFVNLPKLDSYNVCCVFQDCIYVSDGHNVECLDPSNKTWKRKAPFIIAPSSLSHLMCVMTLHGQERLCVVYEDFKLEYYNKSTNKWSRLNCSFSRKLDYMGFAGGMIADGNTVFFYDDHLLGRWENDGVCLQLTYPEEGNDVAVKTLDEHFYPYPTRGEGSLNAHGVMLTVPGNMVDTPDYRIPDDDELYHSDDDEDDDYHSNETRMFERILNSL